MPRTEPTPFRRAGAAPDEPAKPFAQTFGGRLLLVIATVAALSLSFAPTKQFYLAWIGLVPWLVLVGHAQSKKAAFFWSWLTGTLFFSISMWWIAYVTLPGAMGLMLYMGLWFAIAGIILRGSGVLRVSDADPAKPRFTWRPVLSIFAIAAIWVATQWTWGNLFTGLPWLYLGHSQTPILAMCQIADFSGVYGVSFWVALINAWIALLILHRLNISRLIIPGGVILGILALTLAYGLFRINQQTSYPGPRVMVVQPNYPQDNSGAKGASQEELVQFHLNTTRAALKQLAAHNEKPDLIAWSETMMPVLNGAYREAMHVFTYQDGPSAGRNVGEVLDAVYDQLCELTATYGVNLVVGGHTMLAERPKEDKLQWSQRNSAYLFDRTGHEASERYDKIHLVPFGEFMPFRESFPPLYHLFDVFNPYKGKDYTVDSGADLTVFPLTSTPGHSAGSGSDQSVASDSPNRGYRFVTPICFEDVDSTLVAKMFAGPDGTKRADFIVNLTNDGWFATPEMQQHLQLSIFRCIENRVPIARTVNTGISGFVDPVGNVHDLIPAGTIGAATSRLSLDRRVAPYTHLGDLFAYGCVAITSALVVLGLWNGMKNRKSKGR